MHSLVRVLLVAVGAVMVGCGGDGGSRGGDGRTAGAAPADPRPAELAARWWAWASGASDPVRDRTGEACAAGQPDDVFFLAGTPGGKARRTCEVPGGVPLFFPILNGVCPTEGAPASQVAADCGKPFKSADVELTVDGEPGTIEYVESDAFDLEPDPGSFVEGAGGEVVAVGQHALVERLGAGEHEIAFRGRSADGFALDVRYQLTVR